MPLPPQQPTPVVTNHTFHLILTIVTCALWSPIWLIVHLINDSSTKKAQLWYDQARQRYAYDYALWQQQQRF